MGEHFSPILQSLSDAQRRCIQLYKGTDYKRLNSFMRGEISEELSDEEYDSLSEIRAVIDSAFSAPGAYLPIPLTVYRGLKKGYPDRHLRRGSTLIETAFTSASLCHRTAKTIGLWDTECNSSTLLIMSLPAGTPALWIEPLWDKGEYEILLPPPTVLQVSDITQISTQPLRRQVQCQRVQRPKT